MTVIVSNGSKLLMERLQLQVMVEKSDSVCCPNCGCSARRQTTSKSIRTSCEKCDYLLERSHDGQVLDSYVYGRTIQDSS